MAKGVRFWTYERELQLRKWHADGLTLAQIVSKFDGLVSYDSASERVRKLKLEFTKGGNRPRFWTPERDEALRKLWAQSEPILSLQDICDRFDNAIVPSTVSYRAGILKLPRRYGAPRKVIAAPGSKNEGFRSPFAGQNPARGAETPKLRVIPFERFQQCPFYHPMEGGACTEMVDRRERRDGSRPSQYCARHEGRVLPLAKGMLGHVRRHSHGVDGLGRTG